MTDLVEILALLVTQVLLVVAQQPLLLLGCLHPESGGADVVRGLPEHDCHKLQFSFCQRQSSSLTCTRDTRG